MEQDAASGRILNSLIENYTVTFLGITCVSFFYKALFSPLSLAESFLNSFLTWNIGVRGMVAFVANWFSPFADPIAKSYGWPLQSSWQREIASAEGAFGVLGILSPWFSGEFRTATIIAVSFCWFFSELGGLLKIAKRKKDPTYQMNASLHKGMRLDFLFSLVLPLCFLLWKLGY